MLWYTKLSHPLDCWHPHWCAWDQALLLPLFRSSCNVPGRQMMAQAVGWQEPSGAWQEFTGSQLQPTPALLRIYLKEWQRKRQRDCPFTGLLPEQPQEQELSQAEVRSPEFHLGLLHGSQGLKYLGHHPFLSQAHQQGVDQKQSSWDLSCHSNLLYHNATANLGQNLIFAFITFKVTYSEEKLYMCILYLKWIYFSSGFLPQFL